MVFGQSDVFLILVLGFAAFLWLGLYVLARGDRGSISVLLGAAALTTAVFFLQASLQRVLADAPGARDTLARLTWWTNIIPIALWLHLSLSLRRRIAGAPDASQRAALPRIAYGAALVLSLLSMSTNLVVDYGHATITPGPLYAVYLAYLLVGTSIAVVNLSPLGAIPFK